MKYNTNTNTPVPHDKTSACNRLRLLFEQPEACGERGSYVWQNDNAKVTLYLAANHNSPFSYVLELRLHGNSPQHLERYFTVLWSLIGGDMKDALECFDQISRKSAIKESMFPPGWRVSTRMEGEFTQITLKRGMEATT